MTRNKLYLSTIDENAHLLAREYGLGIEIAEFCTPWYLDDQFDQIDPVIREKLCCSDRFVLHGPFSELFPCAIDPKIRAVAADRFRRTIRIAEGYGISKIVVHGGYNPQLYYPVWYVEQSVAFWKEFAAQIPGNMVFCLENVLEEEPSLLAEIVEQVNSPKIRMCLDIGHVNAYSSVPAGRWLDRCAGITEHFHLHNNDGTRDFHGRLWEGTLPIRELLAAIGESCPDATATLEVSDAKASALWLLEL